MVANSNSHEGGLVVTRRETNDHAETEDGRDEGAEHGDRSPVRLVGPPGTRQDRDDEESSFRQVEQECVPRRVSKPFDQDRVESAGKLARPVSAKMSVLKVSR